MTVLWEYAQRHHIPFPALLAVFNAENDFFPDKIMGYDLSRIEAVYIDNFNSLIRSYRQSALAPYIELYENLFAEMLAFPIPTGWYENDASVMFGNSWGVGHNFQGNSSHMGTAILDRENIRGRVPIASMTHGVITQAAWDNHLGYFVGVTTDSGNFYKYAHLDSIAPGIAPGQNVVPGQIIGQMGNTGGGRSSRTFPVHLHVAIRPNVSFTRREFWINPYPILRQLENAREFWYIYGTTEINQLTSKWGQLIFTKEITWGSINHLSG